MKLKQWRQTRKLTLAACADVLGLPHASNYQRYENGANCADAPLVEKIRRMTDGLVTAADIQETRIEWLGIHKPDAMSGIDAVVAYSEAAQ